MSDYDDIDKKTMETESINKATPNPQEEVKDESLTREEIVLYTFTVFILIGISIYFWNIFQSTSNPSPSALVTQDFEALKLSNNKIPVSEQLQFEWMKAQLQVVGKRYELASRINNTYAYVKYISFVVGTVLTLLGTIVIFKGVRHSPIETEMSPSEKIRFKISTSSPGAFMTFLGTVIIVVSITYKGEVISTKDDGIFMNDGVSSRSGIPVSFPLKKTDITFLSDDQVNKLLTLPNETQDEILTKTPNEILQILDTIKTE